MIKMRWVGLSLALFLAACAQPGAAPSTSSGSLGTGPFAGLNVLLTKSPTCTCCSGHADYLRGLGLQVTERASDDIGSVKDEYRIPLEMRSCHTSTLGRYFIEGHVPYAAIEQLFAQRPEIDGISLPGMPAGSPGMGGELAGPLVVYAIRDGNVVGEFGRF